MKNINIDNVTALSPKDLKRKQFTRGWPMSAVGCVVYAVLRLIGQKPKSFYGICPYFAVGNIGNGVSFGWFFICSKGSLDSLKMHELGHLIQNAEVGGVKMLILSIGSVLRFWKRELFGGMGDYYSWWFERQATTLGRAYTEKIRAGGDAHE